MTRNLQVRREGREVGLGVIRRPCSYCSKLRTAEVTLPRRRVDLLGSINSRLALLHPTQGPNRTGVLG